MWTDPGTIVGAVLVFVASVMTWFNHRRKIRLDERKAELDAAQSHADGSITGFKELTDRINVFNETLMKEREYNDLRIKECEARCAKCEADHAQTQLSLSTADSRISELEREVDALQSRQQ